MDDPRLVELEVYLRDEQERADKCEDEFTKQLLLNRCKMWERTIADIKSEHKDKEDVLPNTQTETNPTPD